MIVAKFGGTSVGTAIAIETTAEIVRARVRHGVIVVVSAMAGVTTELVGLAEWATAGHLLDALGTLRRIRARHLDAAHSLLSESTDPEGLLGVSASVSALCDELAHLLEALSVLGHLSPRALDAIAAMGELLSMELVTAAYVARGIPAVAVDPRVVMITDAAHTRAHPLPDRIRTAARERLLPLVAAGQVPVIGGFVGATVDGVTTTLGRGGSDYSASLLGNAAEATAIEIWTDVDGMLTADPRLVSDAQVIDHIRFDEASELATFGAKVLHPSTIAPAVTRGIPVYIFNTHRPHGRGTRIDAAAPRRSLVALAGKGSVTMLKIRSPHMLLAPGFLRHVYQIFEQHRTSVDVVATSEVSVTVTVDGLADEGRDADAVRFQIGPEHRRRRPEGGLAE